MLSEFGLIDQYFYRHYSDNKSVKLGIGDDAAITTMPPGTDQVIAIDSLVGDVHFRKSTSAYLIAWKALAVNLSDLAAMGATPSWFTLALTMPDVDEAWLTDFSKGLFDLAERFKISLIGGDTTRGPLAVSIQVAGFVPEGKALLRSGARPGDHVFVTGHIGDGRAGLAVQQRGARDDAEYYLLQRLQQPDPRVIFGQSLIGVANACIDISDGLLADISHVLDASEVGAFIELDKIPVSNACKDKYKSLGLSRLQLAQGGDDYELVFTVPEEKLDTFLSACDEQATDVTEIGIIKEEKGLRCYQDNQAVALNQIGYQHF